MSVDRRGFVDLGVVGITGVSKSSRLHVAKVGVPPTTREHQIVLRLFLSLREEAEGADDEENEKENRAGQDGGCNDNGSGKVWSGKLGGV